MKIKKLIILFLTISIIPIYGEKLKVIPIEEYNISAGFGVDVKKDVGNDIIYRIPFNIYEFKPNKEESTRNFVGKGTNIGETRSNRQLSSNKPFLIGVQRIIIMGEEAAYRGITNLINVNFASPQINDRSLIAVCKGDAESLLKTPLQGYVSSSDYAEGIIKNSVEFNFFSNEYTFLNIYTRLDSEGRNVVLPYIEINNGEITVSGMAVFNGPKLFYVIPIEESKVMNILREKNVRGTLTLQESPDAYLNYYCQVKRKVKCNKKDGKYDFNINLTFKGDILGNTLYEQMTLKNKKQFEEVMAKQVEKMCNVFLYKMQNEYKMDMLELGMNGAAKFGRDTGVDWNKEVSNANIKVNVKVIIDKIGIGKS